MSERFRKKPDTREFTVEHREGRFWAVLCEGRIVETFSHESTLERRMVAGERMTLSLIEFKERCAVRIEEEQRKTNPDNANIALWCEAIRLAREYEEYLP